MKYTFVKLFLIKKGENVKTQKLKTITKAIVCRKQFSEFFTILFWFIEGI